ncbi:MAG: DUF4037 domain-containing protein [Brevinematales bacterium]|nr:DUF4037 domain-containing protein [Brevinematales bacterium]
MKTEIYKFIPGLELCEGFAFDIVKPLLDKEFPSIAYSAALIGYGSDVLGYDNPASMDHNWGPRMQIFLAEKDITNYTDKINVFLRQNLPPEFKGFPTNFSQPRYDHTQTMEGKAGPPINHLIEIVSLNTYIKKYLGKININDIKSADWITLNDQQLLELTSGRVFHDGLGTLLPLRERINFYPRDVWLFRLAQLWKRIWDEEPFVGRCIENEDFSGLKILAARQTETIITICFYIEKHYFPYSKWFGSAFKRLDCYQEIRGLAETALTENEPARIEDALCLLYEKTVELNNRQGDLPHLGNRIRDFFGRPYKVIFAETIVAALKESITDPELKNIPIE